MVRDSDGNYVVYGAHLRHDCILNSVHNEWLEYMGEKVTGVSQYIEASEVQFESPGIMEFRTVSRYHLRYNCQNELYLKSY